MATNAVTSTNITNYAAKNSWGINPARPLYLYCQQVVTDTCGANPGYLVTARYPYNIMNYLFIGLTLNARSCFPINVS